MRYWDRLKNYFYQRRLVRMMAGVTVVRTVIRLQDARSVGIIFDATNTENDTVILPFAEKLRNDGKEVEMLGFVNNNKPDSRQGMTLINRKNIRWTETPKAAEAEKFAQKNFDLLLACFTGDCLPLEFIAGTCNARWRVGKFAENKTGLYDLMINIGDRKDLGYLLEQMGYFLNYITPATDR